MANLSVKDGKLALKCRFHEKERAKSVQGYKWNADDKTWEFPLDRRVVQQITSRFGTGLEVDQEVHDYIDAVERDRAERVESKYKEDMELSVPFAHKLRNYQRVGAGFMLNGKNVILADDMGTGKTLQAITACEESGAKRVIVVCPNSLKWTWKEEVHKWTGSSVTVVDGDKKKRERIISEYSSGYLVINYDSLKLHPELNKRRWGVAVFDEAHKLKNRKTQQTKAAKKVKSDRTFLLTGTPMLNRAEELWSLLNKLYPKEYSSFWRFVDQYCDVFDNGFGQEIAPGDERQKEALSQDISPIMIRRVKSEVLKELPDKIHTRQLVGLGKQQQKLYQQMEEDAFVELTEHDSVAAPIVISQITRLRQLAISPQLLSQELDVSAKFDAVMDIVSENVENHKIVVFSQFRKGLELLSHKLNERGVKWEAVTGKVSQEGRQRASQRFQEDEDTRMMLATIEAGGLGLTWTSADIAIFLDRHWTPAINQQAEDRLHRMGQKNAVNIINLVAKDTIEERIENMLENKAADFDEIINNEVTPEQLEALFGQKGGSGGAKDTEEAF